MSNEAAKELVSSLMETLRAQQRDMAGLQQRMAAVTASAWSSQELVHVSVNARGIVIAVQFHPEAVERAGGLTALGRYVTEATQKAAQSAADQVQTIMEPMRERVEVLPQASEIFPDLPSASDFIPDPVEPSLAPPEAPERRYTPAVDDPDVYYGETETLRRDDGGAVERTW